MANFIVTWDLNGPTPSHAEMDELIRRVSIQWARILETVWWVNYSGTLQQLLNELKASIGGEDLLLVIEAKDAGWTKLLIDGKPLIDAWAKAA